MSSFPAEYRYFHLIIFPLFIASSIPIYHIYTKAICGISCCYKKSKIMHYRGRTRTHTNPNPSVETVTITSSPSPNSPSAGNSENSYGKSRAHNATKEATTELPLKLRICLFISITLSTIYMILNTIQVSFYFINSDHSYSPILFCKFKNSLQVLCYIWGRGSLYFFFIFRGQYIFQSTALQYKNRTICWILTAAIVACSIATVPTIYINWTQQRHYIISDINNQGTICASEIDNDDVHVTLSLIWVSCILLGQLGDTIIAYLTVHITASRLFNVVREQSAKNGHNDTSKENAMILLVSRLFILLCIAIITSQLAVILAIFSLKYLIIWYGIDCCINMYCLWLNFGFSSEYYYKYFCGRSCIKCCFPCVKTLALTCMSCGDVESTSCNQCCDCCCYCCKYCCCNKQSRENQLKLYVACKAETEMIEYE